MSPYFFLYDLCSLRADISLFFRVNPENVFHFDSSFRPVPLHQTLVGVEESDPIKRLVKFNIACYDHAEAAIKSGHQVMVFVHSRGETKVVADALLDISRQRKQNTLFQLNPSLRAKFEPLVRKSRDLHLKRLFEWGVGVHHAGMMRSDRSLTEKMFLEGD